MADDYLQHATGVVQKFKAELEPEVSAQLAPHEELLAEMIAGLVADEMQSTVDKIENLVRELRASISKPDLAL